MAEIGDAVAGYLNQRQWPYEDRGQALATPVAGRNGSWVAFFEIREEDDQLLVYSIMPFDVPEARRTEAALYLTRANFGLAIGNFERSGRHGLQKSLLGAILFCEVVDLQFHRLVVSAQRKSRALSLRKTKSRPRPMLPSTRR